MISNPILLKQLWESAFFQAFSLTSRDWDIWGPDLAHPVSASCPHVRQLCLVILYYHGSGSVCSEKFLGEQTQMCLCKSSPVYWWLFLLLLFKGVWLPAEQPGWSSSYMYHVKRQQLVLHGCRGGKVFLIAKIRTRRGGGEAFKQQDWAYNMWPACAIQALGVSRSTHKGLWLGNSRKEKRHRRMGDSKTPASRRGLQVHKARLTVSCHPAPNSAWSPGRMNAQTVQDINYFFTSLKWFWLMVLWGRGRHLLGYVVAVWRYCICGEGGMLGDCFWGLLLQEVIQNFGFSGRIFEVLWLWLREQACGLSRHQREKTQMQINHFTENCREKGEKMWQSREGLKSGCLTGKPEGLE